MGQIKNIKLHIVTDIKIYLDKKKHLHHTTRKMPAADPRVRQLTIKTGVVKRLYKEKNMYEKESKQMEEKVEKMKAAGEDEYNIKKQIEVKNESLAMVPDCKKRLKT